MSNVIISPFAFEQTADNRWLVYLGQQSTVVVQTREEAEVVASLRVELERFRSDSPKKPNLLMARKIVEVCKRYKLWRTVPAVRELDSRVKNAET